MTLHERWAGWRTRGPQQLTATLALFLGGFFLLPTGKAVNNVYYTLVLAPALLLLRGADWRWLAGSALWRAAMTLLAYLAVSGLWTEHAGWGDWLGQAKSLVYLGVYLALVACVFARRIDGARWLMGALVLAATAGTVISAIRFYSVAAWPLRLEYASAVYNANEGATAAGTALLLALFWMAPASAGRGRRSLWMLAGAVLLAGMTASGSRTPLAAVLVCGVLGLVLQRRWRVLAGFGAVALVIGTLLAGSDATRQALARGDSYRPAIWQQFAARVAQRPWFGEGVLTDDSTEVATPGGDTATLRFLHPHSVYLATALYGGLPALLLLLVLIALAMRQGWALARHGEPAWLLVLIFALLCMLTDGDRLLHAPRAIWVYFWLPIGVLIGLGLRPPGGKGSRAASAWPVAPYRSE